MAKLLTKPQILDMFTRFHAHNPHPKGELDYINDFTLLVAVVLSAQATDKGVNKATPALFAAAPTPQKMVDLGEDAIREHIKTIGLYKSKAKNVFLLAQKLMSDFNGQIPQTRDALMSLAGVGRKTANVVLNIAFGQPTIAVDTHIFRVSNRTGLAHANTPEKIEAALEKKIPQAFKRDSHHWLILHGRYVCKARSPDCKACIINDICLYPDKTR